MKTEDFIKRSQKVWGNRFDYSETEYETANKKVGIICKEHGKFYQLPYSHLYGMTGCPFCKWPYYGKEAYIKRANEVHGNKYDYSKIDLRKSNEKIEIGCPEHGYFWQMASDHLRGKGCPICGGCKKKTNEEFVEECVKKYGDKYDYSKAFYETAHKKILIHCNEHNIDFWQTPNNHLRFVGCPKCIQSKDEKLVENLLNEMMVRFEREKDFDWLKSKKNMHLDFFLPDFNIAIECQGEQHFSNYRFEKGEKTKSLEKRKFRDKLKKELCESNGVNLIYFSTSIKNDECLGEKIIHDKEELKNRIYEKC